MLHTSFIKCKVDVMYFIFIFISSSVPRFSVKKSVNQLTKNKRPYLNVKKLNNGIQSKILTVNCKMLTDYEVFSTFLYN